jgi:MFS family permease
MVYAHASKNEVNVENGKRHFSGYLIGVIVFMSLGTSAYGFSNAIIATTFAQPSFLLQMGLNDAPNAAGLIGSVTGLYYAGGVAGSICHGWATPRHGPKASVAIGCVFLIVSSAVLTGAVNIAMFIVFRFFNGWG